MSSVNAALTRSTPIGCIAQKDNAAARRGNSVPPRSPDGLRRSGGVGHLSRAAGRPAGWRKPMRGAESAAWGAEAYSEARQREGDVTLPDGTVTAAGARRGEVAVAAHALRGKRVGRSARATSLPKTRQLATAAVRPSATTQFRRRSLSSRAVWRLAARRGPLAVPAQTSISSIAGGASAAMAAGVKPARSSSVFAASTRTRAGIAVSAIISSNIRTALGASSTDNSVLQRLAQVVGEASGALKLVDAL